MLAWQFKELTTGHPEFPVLWIFLLAVKFWRFRLLYWKPFYNVFRNLSFLKRIIVSLTNRVCDCLGHVGAFCKRLYRWVGALLLLHNITQSLYRSNLNRKYSNHILDGDWKLHVIWNWLASYRFSPKSGRYFSKKLFVVRTEEL